MDLGDDRDASILGGDDEAGATGSPASEAGPVAHRLTTPTPDAAEALAAIVRNHGYEVDVEGSSLVARRYEANDEELLADARALLRELAAEHGGSYEGSGAEPPSPGERPA